ncbi:MAG: transglycosylase [Deltaproteobacteria bacterium]|nr:transglycosylase [Deltaproteobacteria bacterium]
MTRRAPILLLALFVLSGCAGREKKPLSLPTTVKPAPSTTMPSPFPQPTPPAEIVPTPVVPQPVPPLVRLPADQFPLFTDDMDLPSLERAIEKSLQYYARASGSGPYRMDQSVVTVRELRESLLALKEILRRDEPIKTRQERIRETFDVYRSTGLDGKDSVLFTGYFEPILQGSLKKTAKYRYPVYKAPADAVVVNLGKFREKQSGDQLVGRVKNGELVPYYSRSEIEDLAALAGRNLEIAWVDDRISLFFLHTQGSGKIKLPNGKLLQIGYAMKNGRPYQSVGRFLIDTGKIASEDMSYQAIKRYLRQHPEDLSELLGHNESFIFFREVKEGPVGSLGEVLTAGRSIATDAVVFPRGALAFIRTQKPILDPEGNVLSWVPFSRFVVAQDAGGMIKGAGRVDLFCGTGDEAEMLAGSLKERGELYFLVKKREKSR